MYIRHSHPSDLEKVEEEGADHNTCQVTTKQNIGESARSRAAVTKGADNGVLSIDKPLVGGEIVKPTEKLVIGGNNSLYSRMVPCQVAKLATFLVLMTLGLG